MYRHWSLVLLTLLLAGCGVAAMPEGYGTPVGAGAARATVVEPPAAGQPATAPPNPNIPTATPAPPLPGAFPALAAGQPYLYVVDYYRTIRVVDPRAATVVGELPVGAGALPVFSPDGSRLYVTHAGRTGDGTGAQLDVFEVATGRRLAGVAGLELMAYKIWGPPILAPARDGSTVYLHGRRITSRPGEAGRDSCWLYTFDVGANRLAPDTIPLPTCQIAPLVLSADGGTLYSGPWLVDLTVQPAAMRENPDLAERAVAQSPDGRWLYALDRDGNVTVWDADARRVVRTIPGAAPAYGSYVYLAQQTLHLDRAGTRLFIATDEGDRQEHAFKGVVTLDAATGQRLGTLRAAAPFRDFTISADGLECYLLAQYPRTSDTPGMALEVWDLATGTRRASVRGIGDSAGPVLAPNPP